MRKEGENDHLTTGFENTNVVKKKKNKEEKVEY